MAAKLSISLVMDAQQVQTTVAAPYKTKSLDGKQANKEKYK